MRQLYESDRKFRALLLVKYSNVSLRIIDEAAKARKTDQTVREAIAKADPIAAELRLNIFPLENDVAVIFNVGYCSRSLVKGNKCESCKERVVTVVGQVTEIYSDLPENVAELFDNINRRGLWKPTI